VSRYEELGLEEAEPNASGRRVFRSPKVVVATALVVVIAAVSAFFLLHGSPDPACAGSGTAGNTPSCVDSGASGTIGG
jgi:hypothetical protein